MIRFFRQFLRFISLFSLALTLSVGLFLGFSQSTPAQLINFPEQLINETVNGMSRFGNLDVGDIKLDGKVLFQVAAPSPHSLSSSDGASPIELRVKSVTSRLQNVLNIGFDPNALSVVPAILNNETVIVVSTHNWGPQSIVTVTQNDVDISLLTTIDAVANDWSEIIHQALVQGQAQRQPTYRWVQVPILIKRLLLTIMTSLGVYGLQKVRWSRHLSIERQQQAQQLAQSDDLGNHLSESSLADKIHLSSQQTDSASGHSPKLTNQRLRRLIQWLPKLSLEQQHSLNSLAHPMLMTLQVTIWFVGIASLFYRFPETRGLANWLLRLPLRIIVVIIAMTMAKQLADILVQVLLRRFHARQAEKRQNTNRSDLRLHTISLVLSSLNRWIVIILSILLFFYLIESLVFGLIILAGLGFLAKDTLNNYIQTFFILGEDQYILEDVISIEDAVGKNIFGAVEKINLRATQLRNLDGQLITIPHGNIVNVTNFTHQWSQVNLGLDVAYSTDLNQAMNVINTVAKTMQVDPVWQDTILEDPTILGVDGFGENSITIRLLIKTLPAKQWDVAREYRRRLKLAFDQAGIQIPFPQRSIWFENPLPGNP